MITLTRLQLEAKRLEKDRVTVVNRYVGLFIFTGFIPAATHLRHRVRVIDAYRLSCTRPMSLTRRTLEQELVRNPLLTNRYDPGQRDA